MLNMFEVAETNEMIEKENLDVRTITLGISLLDCIDSDLDRLKEKIYEKITSSARDLVKTNQHLDPDEYVELGTYDLDELVDKIYAGEIQDAKTVAAIMAYKNLTNIK